MTNETAHWTADIRHAGRGLLMGGADIIPGVSGGTVALILGIYSRLVGAISHFDFTWLGLLRHRQWTEAARYVDLRFLAALAIGILAGIVSLAKLMHYLLAYQRPYTLAAFFGLIVASSILVARMTDTRTGSQLWTRSLLGIMAALFAFWLVGQEALLQPQPGLAYIFLCGIVAICAMILPGISGAYILLIMGKYDTILEVIHRLTAFDAGLDDFLTLAVFASGCGIGLVTFSKALRALLARYHGPTMAILCGLMVGSLWKIWPFQIDTTLHVESLKRKIYEPIWPQEWNGEVTACLGIGIAAAAFVLVADYVARQRKA